ncbi:MAG: secretin N-terminal domain-containing protein, partial [Longimicrobiales bacterium]
LATTLGVNVLLTNVPDKRITFQTTVPVRPEDLGGILESILEAHNLFLVQQGPVAQVFPADSLPPTGLIRSGIALGTPPPLGLVTVLVPLQWIRADEATAALKPVASTRARIQPVARSNALLITDFGSNVARYLELLRPLDERPLGEEGMRTFVVPLKYANAEDLAASLGQLYSISVGGSRAASLYELSLSRNLDVYRERAAEMFRQRREPIPGIVPTAPGDTAMPGALVGRTTVVPDAPTNSLLIRTAPPNFPLLRETIEALDARPAQVLLEVTVAEINLGRSFEFGIDWGIFGDTAFLRRGFPFLPLDSIGIVRGDEVTGIVSVGLNGTNVRAALRALATKFNVRVLSTPEILAVNNREARIVVGSRVPFISNARLGDVSIDRSVQYEDVGTTLTIIPTVNQDNYVSVQILQEVNNLTNQVVLSALNAPVISTREASTRAIIRDGQTVVIGGLIGDTKDYSDGGIPFLKDIPLLGALFKRKTEIVSRNELAIFVTPYIIRSDQDADEIRERIRERMNRMLPGTVPDSSLIRRR